MADETIGEWIRRERKARNWTQADLAERVGANVHTLARGWQQSSTVARWESGERSPGPHYARMLRDVFGSAGPDGLHRRMRADAAVEPVEVVEEPADG